MVSKETIDRINELAAKHKSEGLNEEELKEREELRKEYISAIRGQVKHHLSRVKFVEDLTEEEKAEYLKQNEENK